MKRWIVAGIISALGMMPLSAMAHDEEKGKTTITGEVVDVTCYLSHPDSGIGEGHAKCATDCINKGLPVAIKSGNQLYLAGGANHNSANKMLAKYAGKQVKVTGTVAEQDGLHMIFIENVEEQK